MKRPFVAWMTGSRDPILRHGEFESAAEAFEELTSGDSSFLVELANGIYEMGKDPEETLYDMTSPVALQQLALNLAEYIAVNGPVMLCDGSDHVPVKVDLKRCRGCLFARETVDATGFCVTCRSLRDWGKQQ